MSDAKKPDTTNASTDEVINKARRRLLLRAVYVPPAVIGIVSLQQAGCQPRPSCNPNTCGPATTPCQPDNNPCNPNTGCNPNNCNPNAG
jgi:hypothetical protein